MKYVFTIWEPHEILNSAQSERNQSTEVSAKSYAQCGASTFGKFWGSLISKQLGTAK